MKKAKVEKRGKTLIIKITVDPFAGGSHTTYSGYGLHVKGTSKHNRVSNRLEARKAQRGDYD
jgi:hypothetical protein